MEPGSASVTAKRRRQSWQNRVISLTNAVICWRCCLA